MCARRKTRLYRVTKGGYYGHPDPLRCEWVMNGSKSTSGVDFAEVAQYPSGTQPDRNYRRNEIAFDFGTHFSPNGAISTARIPTTAHCRASCWWCATAAATISLF